MELYSNQNGLPHMYHAHNSPRVATTATITKNQYSVTFNDSLFSQTPCFVSVTLKSDHRGRRVAHQKEDVGPGHIALIFPSLEWPDRYHDVHRVKTSLERPLCSRALNCSVA